MMLALKKFLSRNEWALVLFLVLLFIFIRLPGIDLPLHQDEYKWPQIVNPMTPGEVTIPHPPLSQFIYRTAGSLVGFDTDFRFVPLFFGTINLLLLYYFVRSFFGRREAVFAGIIWVFAYFSVLASLMVDTDGEILPFFFLLSLISYYKLVREGRPYLWGSLLLIFCILGFLVKVSFAIAIAAIFADFLWSKRSLLSRGDILKYLSYILAGVLGLTLLLFIMKFIFPFFNLSQSLKYWEHFAVSNRNWFQTFIQCIKAVLYSSPFLILAPFFAPKEIFAKARVFVFFLIFAFIFYIVLFDFSLGALDRYLQLMVLPLSIFGALILSKFFETKNTRISEFLFLGTIVALVLVILQSVPHYVPSLHPKAEWIDRILSFEWNFVYPFSGGSGPLGFYVSFLFLGLSWLISLGVVIFAIFKPEYKKLSLAFLLPLGFAYNLVFIEEHLVGFWNGNAANLVSNATEFIKNNENIKKVTVYNDNGGNEIQAIGKYEKRLYFDPKLNMQKKVLSFNQFKEHYLVIDVPRLPQDSFYQEYFNSCEIVYEDTDKKMTAIIYDCKNAPDIKI